MNASTIKMPNHRRALHGARRVHITETPRNIFPAGIAVYNIRTDQIEDRREAEHTCPPESITALASSINKYGVIHPLSVKVSGEERYVLVSGSRRLRAARLLGLCEVPCIVITADDARSVGTSISENVHTHTMHYIDVALAIEEMRCRLALSVEGVAAALCFKADQLQHIGYTLPDLCFLGADHTHGKCHVFIDSLGLDQAEILEHDAYGTAQIRNLPLANALQRIAVYMNRS